MVVEGKKREEERRDEEHGEKNLRKINSLGLAPFLPQLTACVLLGQKPVRDAKGGERCPYEGPLHREKR